MKKIPKKDLNKESFTKLYKEAYPEKFTDTYGLIPNTWYTMTKGTRTLAFYKGESEMTLGMIPENSSFIGGSFMCLRWFSSRTMRADNVIPANVRNNVLPKLISYAKSFGFASGRKVKYFTLYGVLQDYTYWRVEGQDLIAPTYNISTMIIEDVYIMRDGIINKFLTFS